MAQDIYRILLVEDEMTNMIVLSAYLRHAGYHVDEVTDGLKAWQQLNHDADYDLVVTDRLMPYMDGLELFSCMKKDARFSGIPVIMQTAAAALEQVVEGIKSGVYYYLTKPYQEEALLTLVQSAIRDRQQQTGSNDCLIRLRAALATLDHGHFSIRTPDDARGTAVLLGSLWPQGEQFVCGLYELLLNAIEHGNLQIGHDHKTRLLNDGQWDTEIARRLALPEYQDKQVRIDFTRHSDRIEIEITNQGAGFDWQPFLNIEPERVTQPNGRGIAKAYAQGFDQLNYEDDRRTVRITVATPQPVVTEE